MRANGVNAVLTPSFGDTEAYLRAHWQPGDLVLTMGCGNITQLNEQMNEHEAARARACPVREKSARPRRPAAQGFSRPHAQTGEISGCPWAGE
jgi:hypothetical protein